MTKVLLLTSGGLDSTTVAYWLRERKMEIVPLFFDYGQHCVEKEWSTLRRVLPRVGVAAPTRVDISGVLRGSQSRLISEPDLWNDPVAEADLYVPYRTLLFFSAGVSRAQTLGLTALYSGFINSNYAKELDCSAAFLNGLGALTSDIGPVRIHIPFREWSKGEVVSEAARLGVPIGETFSCQLFSDNPCGACPNCVERLRAIQSTLGAE